MFITIPNVEGGFTNKLWYIDIIPYLYSTEAISFNTTTKLIYGNDLDRYSQKWGKIPVFV